MEGSFDNFFLMRLGQCVESYRISGYTNRQAWIFIRIVVGIHQNFSVENVYIQVMRPLTEVTAEQLNQSFFSALSVFSERIRRDAEGIGNTILASIPVDLRYGVQGSNRTGVVSAVHWVCTWSKRSAGSSSVRSVSGP